MNDGRCLPDLKTWEGGILDVYISKIDSSAGDDEQRGYHGITRQLVMSALSPAGETKMSGHQNGKEIPVPAFPLQIKSMQPSGYELTALIPLSFFLVDEKTDQFYLESAVVVAPGPGAPAGFCRIFQRLPDGGAFRDNSQSALATVSAK